MTEGMKLFPVFSFICLAALASPLKGQLILLDSFDTDGTGVNEDLGSRQFGSIATANWLTASEGATPEGSQVIRDNQLALGVASGGLYESNARLDIDFAKVDGLLAGGAFQVSFKVNPTGSYAAFTLGSKGDLLDSRPLIRSSTDFGIVMKNGLSGAVYSHSGQVATFQAMDWNSGPLLLTIMTESFDEGVAYTISATVGGSTLDLNGEGAGTDFTGTWDSDGVNYMYLSGRGTDSTFDSFHVSAVPKPASTPKWP